MLGLPTLARADRIDDLLPAAELQGDELYRSTAAESFGDWLARMVPVKALTGPQKPFSRSYALVIGVSDYGGSLSALSSTADNPKRMRDLLIGQRFDLVITLSNARATKDRIEYLMGDFFPGIVGGNDRFLFYFSGHGVVQPSGEGFLPLTDSRGEYWRMLPMRNVWTWDGSLRDAKQVLFLLDTCFSGLAAVETQAQADLRSLSVDQLAKRGHHLITAATSGQQTIASERFSGSIFTDSLIDAAQGAADKPVRWDSDGDGREEQVKDGVVSIYELLAEVRTQVALKAANLGWDATIAPQLTPMRKSEGEFFFVTQEQVREVTRSAMQSAVQSQGTPPTPLQGFDARAIELAFWQSAERGGQCADYRDYLDRFPGGTYASLARRRATDLCALPSRPDPGTARAGGRFTDCPDCPEMVVIPAGSFQMGSTEAERAWAVEQGGQADWYKDEQPRHPVTVGYDFAVSRTEITRGQFARFVEATGHRTDGGCNVWTGSEWKLEPTRSWRSPGFEQTDGHPVVCVSWQDTQAYVKWLSTATRQSYRLLSEAEWEYAARGRTETFRYWGDDRENKEACVYANGADLTAKEKFSDWKTLNCHDGAIYTSLTGSYKENAFLLEDMLGNAWEWTEDCYHDSYGDAPRNGSAWTGGCGASPRRVLRGGSWGSGPRNLRSANRIGYAPEIRISDAGFRVARTFTP